MVKNIKFIAILLICASFSSSQDAYILKHLKHAQYNEKECGVPIEITLAQALLESGGGVSAVARSKNNHFGIKQGAKYREFKNVIDCYEFHGEFMHNHYINAVGKPADYWLKWCKGYGGNGYWRHVARYVDHYNLKKYRENYVWH